VADHEQIYVADIISENLLILHSSIILPLYQIIYNKHDVAVELYNFILFLFFLAIFMRKFTS